MSDPKSITSPASDNVLERLLMVSGSSTLKGALDSLIQTAKTSEGRLDLAFKHIILPVLELCQSPHHCPSEHLSLAIRLLRNLCAGEATNQNLFIEHDGVRILSNAISSFGPMDAFENGTLHVVLQVLGNVSLAGEKHCQIIWFQFFPHEFGNIARFRSCKICDRLCMIIYVCLESWDERVCELLSGQGKQLLIDIMQTVAIAGFEESWVKLLVYRICIEKNYFHSVFNLLSDDKIHNLSPTNHFAANQAALMRVLAESVNDHVGEVAVSSEFSVVLFELLRKAVEIVNFGVVATLSALPTCSADADVLGYTLSILRDISACDCPTASNHDPVSVLVSAGIIKFLIDLLRDLEPPAVIRKATACNSDKDEAALQMQALKHCPYKGFRRDIVAILGNCSYRRTNVQDEVRDQDGVFLLLQQCVTDEENPYMREWGIWSLRNILDGNTKNQQLVAELELRQPVDTPEIHELGIKVEVDPHSGRPKLVNLTS